MNIIIKAKKVNNAKNLNKNTKYITRWVKNITFQKLVLKDAF